jgi:pimeloyl-ACP methyl ester carboxylesterase
MPQKTVNNIQIEYDTFGDPMSNPLLLVMGLGSQMIRWPEEFCEMLVKQGFYVIRFDNRDVGLSTKFEKAGVPDIRSAIVASQKGEEINSPYSLEDMAHDAIGLLDAMGISKAHICGASMGGMIAQIIAYRYPNRVLSLTSIMSSTGNPELPQAKPEVMQILFTPVPKEREKYIKESVKRRHIIYGSGFPFDEELAKTLAVIEYDRCFYPVGLMRQLMAIMANGNRKIALNSIKVPTLVIHGTDDPLVPVEGGKDTVDAIPGAELLLIDGMGHSLPPETWTQVVNAIVSNASKV